MRHLLLTLVAIILASLPLSAATPKGAHLKLITESKHDYGEVKRTGGDLVRSFEFINDGSSPLVITRTITGCSCVKVDYPHKPIAAGGKGTIKVTYEIHKKEEGSFSKIIQIYSNATPSRTTINILGVSR